MLSRGRILALCEISWEFVISCLSQSFPRGAHEQRPWGRCRNGVVIRPSQWHGVCATTLDDSELALDAGITCDPDLAQRAYWCILPSTRTWQAWATPQAPCRPSKICVRQGFAATLRGRCARAAGPPGRRAGDCDAPPLLVTFGTRVDRPRFGMAGEGVTAMIVTADAGDNPPRTAARTRRRRQSGRGRPRWRRLPRRRRTGWRQGGRSAICGRRGQQTRRRTRPTTTRGRR